MHSIASPPDRTPTRTQLRTPCLSFRLTYRGLPLGQFACENFLWCRSSLREVAGWYDFLALRRATSPCTPPSRHKLFPHIILCSTIHTRKAHTSPLSHITLTTLTHNTHIPSVSLLSQSHLSIRTHSTHHLFIASLTAALLRNDPPYALLQTSPRHPPSPHLWPRLRLR